MAAQDYDACETHVLRSEGGYTNHPSDPGGPTNWGITIYDARQHWKANATAEDVKSMPLSVAKGIYKPKYWDALNCDALPPGLDYTVFDYGVNSGIARSGRVLRQVIGQSTSDWHVTPDIIAWLERHHGDVPSIIKNINDSRLRFLEGLKTWPVFGRGWGDRVRSVKAISLHMAGAAPDLEPIHASHHDVPQGKGATNFFDLIAHIFGGK